MKILQKLEQLIDLLKGLKSGMSGPVTLPSISSVSSKPSLPKMPTAKIPGVSPTTSKSPTRIAGQIRNPNVKDQKMKEAQEMLRVNKCTGQWSLDKTFVSEAQRRYMWAAADRGEIPKSTVQEFADKTPKNAKLPYHVKKDEMKPSTPPVPEHDKYHIHEQGIRITDQPLSLKEIGEKHGGVKRLESNGFRVVPVSSSMKKDELKEGIKVEREHSDTIKQIQEDAKNGKIKPLEEYLKLVAKDHIDEIKDYYSRLMAMEAKAKK